MRYKVGDKVRIRYNLGIGETYGGEVFVDDMNVFSGKQATITEIENGEYYIDLDEGEFIWTDEMFVDETFKNSLEHIKHLEQLLDKAMSVTIRQYQEIYQELNEIKKIINYNEN